MRWYSGRARAREWRTVSTTPFPIGRGLAVLLAVLLLPGLAAAGEGHEPSAEASRQLGQGWTWLEAGNLRKAEDTFRALADTPEGRLNAEVHYAMSVVWWERGDARAAWSWLKQGQDAALGSHDWNPGIDGRWSRRIDERLNYIRARFTVRKLKTPERGTSVPPLADPPPADPVLREFTDAIARLVQASEEEAPNKAIWLVIPNGSYWIGDRLEWHDGGELDASKAETWDLEPAANAAMEAYDRRLQTIADGGSEGRELIRKLMIARRAPPGMVRAELQREKAEALAAEYAKRRTELEAARARQQALLAAGKLDEASRVSFGFNASAGGETKSAILTWDEADAAGLGAIAAEISEVWTDSRWHMRYAVQTPSKDTMHAIQLPDLGVTIKFDKGGDLTIRGTNKVKESMRDSWHLGGRPNRIDIWFDGTHVRVIANGREVGPVQVAKHAPSGRTRWKLTMNDDTALMFDLRVEQFAGF